MIWVKKEIDARKTNQLVKTYNLDLITATILNRRNILKPEEIIFFLEDDIRFLHNPFLFKDMAKAVERINKAVAENETVLVYGDRDVDGITATVLAVEMLKKLGLKVLWKVPLGDDDYGLSIGDVEEAYQQGVKLLLTVDCGISNFKEIQLALEQGIEVIVLDHHLPPQTIPPAYAIINPKMPDSGYPFRDLSGCGVVSKLAWAISFARTSFFQKPIVLLHITPLHESFLLEALFLENLVKKAYLRETLVPALGKQIWNKLQIFINNKEVYIYDAHEQQHLLKKCFGDCALGLRLFDLKDYLEGSFVHLKKKSLLTIRELSRVQRYASSFSELEAFYNLFVSIVLYRESAFFEGFLAHLDLVALGTIADLMPLRNENRILVKKGLEVINQFLRPGLRELCLKKNLITKKISVKEIGWQLGPLINATGRLGQPNKAVELLLGRESDLLSALANEIIKLNDERKNMIDMIWNMIYNEATNSLEKTDGKFVFISGSSIHRGITGLLATQIVKFFKTPACVVAELKDKAVGSLRSVADIALMPFLESFKDLFSDWGGHDLAAGFNLPLENMEVFKERFYHLVKKMDRLTEKEEELIIDAEIPLKYLGPDLYKVVERLAPYGEAHPPLLFYTAGLRVINCEVVGKKEHLHLKLLLDTGKYKLPAMLWNGVEQYGQNFKIGDQVDVVYRFHKNCYQNSETLQLIVCDLALSGQKRLTFLMRDALVFDSKASSSF